MIPLWKCAPAIACGNAFILKPSERDPGVPMMLVELFMEAGLPAGILNVVNGDKEAVDAILDHRDIVAIGLRRLDAHRGIYLRARLRGGQTRAVLRRRQEPHDHHAGRRHGPGGRCAGRRGLRFGWRALHGGVRCSPGWKEDRRQAGRQTHPAGGKPQDRPVHLERRRPRPDGDRRISRRSRTMSRSASRKAPS